MERSTIHCRVQRCPNCGYCNYDLEESVQGAESVIGSHEYKSQLNNSDFPELACSFLSKALIEEASGNFVSAAWSLIHAAWVCDDHDL